MIAARRGKATRRRRWTAGRPRENIAVMGRIAYVNGRYVRHAEAGISIYDRAVNFGDGVYEVCEVRDGALIEGAAHGAS